MAKEEKKVETPAADEAKKIAEGALNDKNAYIDPGPKPDGFFKRIKWRRKVRKERRKLRRRLKSQGIKDRETFEKVAWELGLILDDGFWLIWWDWWRWFWLWLTSSLGLKALIGVLGSLLFLAFLASYMSELGGAFTVNLTNPALRRQFSLSETVGFENPSAYLYSEKCKDINNISIEDISRDVDDIEGAHNGKNYVAYTFYIKNRGEEVGSYSYTLKHINSSFGVNQAIWMMLYEDGHQVIYADTSADGDPEKLYGYNVPPFVEDAYNKNSQYYQRDGLWGIETTAFLDKDTIVQGIVNNVQPGEYHKYTVVIWLEGNDPECTDEIFGGYAKYGMEFDVIDESKFDIFSGIYRTEYDDYANGIEQ